MAAIKDSDIQDIMYVSSVRAMYVATKNNEIKQKNLPNPSVSNNIGNTTPTHTTTTTTPTPTTSTTNGSKKRTRTKNTPFETTVQKVYPDGQLHHS